MWSGEAFNNASSFFFLGGGIFFEGTPEVVPRRWALNADSKRSTVRDAVGWIYQVDICKHTATVVRYASPPSRSYPTQRFVIQALHFAVQFIWASEITLPTIRSTKDLYHPSNPAMQHLLLAANANSAQTDNVSIRQIPLRPGFLLIKKESFEEPTMHSYTNSLLTRLVLTPPNFYPYFVNNT